MRNDRAVTLCVLLLAGLLSARSSADDWPQWRGPTRDGVWRETGIRSTFGSDSLPRRWTAPISSGYSGPTVADGRVFVSDYVKEPRESERIHCFAWRTGDKLWSHTYDCQYRDFKYQAGPRTSVLIDKGPSRTARSSAGPARAFSLGATGHLVCLDAATGTLVWQKDLNTENEIRMPDWGISASPIIEDDLLIAQIGGKDACLVALDKTNGEERWKSLPDEASYSAPIVIDQAQKRMLVCWTAERLVGLEPRTGTLLWEFPFRYEKWPIAIADPVRHGDFLLLSESHKGSLLLRLLADRPTVEKVWHQRGEGNRSTEALHCLQSTPLVSGAHLYGIDNQGVLRCLDLETGRQVWQDETAVPRSRWATGHLVKNGDLTWIFNERGELLTGRLSPTGFTELSRAKLIEPTTMQLPRRGGVTWSHPAFAYRHVFARNDRELVCADLSAE